LPASKVNLARRIPHPPDPAKTLCRLAKTVINRAQSTAKRDCAPSQDGQTARSVCGRFTAAFSQRERIRQRIPLAG